MSAKHHSANTRKVLLIDDELAAIKSLRAVIKDFPELDIIAEIGDGRTAIREITRLKPDIVFLDIEMPEVNGFDVAKATEQLNYQLVFVTAYDQYALDAFGTNAIDYLLKPVRPALLKKCIQKMLHQEELILQTIENQEQAQDTLALSDGNSTRMFHKDHISHIEGLGRYRRIHLTHQGMELHKTDTIISGTTLDEFESQLQEKTFIRLHRSFIVNTELIINLFVDSRRHYISLKNIDVRIPVSRNKVSELKAVLSNGMLNP